MLTPVEGVGTDWQEGVGTDLAIKLSLPAKCSCPSDELTAGNGGGICPWGLTGQKSEASSPGTCRRHGTLL